MVAEKEAVDEDEIEKSVRVLRLRPPGRATGGRAGYFRWARGETVAADR